MEFAEESVGPKRQNEQHDGISDQIAQVRTDIKRKQSETLTKVQVVNKGKIQQDLIDEFYEYYRPYNQQIYKFLNRDMQWEN